MKVAVLSSWHVHTRQYAQEFKAIPGCEVPVLWDEDRDRGQKMAEELGCRFTDNLQSVLKDPTIDAVQITTRTNLHQEIIPAAAQHGKHIFTEKVLAIGLEDALMIKQAVQASGVTFAISFPHLSRPELIRAGMIASSGELGKITYARVRNVHGGSVQNWLPDTFYDAEQCGGGAMIDLGAHPMYTLPWLLGKPVTVQSLFSNVTDRGVEDNAVSLIEFDQGAIGVSETGFVSVDNPYTLEISGTQGCLYIRDQQLMVSSAKTNHQWTQVTDLPAANPSPLRYFADACMHGTAIPAYLGIDSAVELTRLMQAAYLSQTTGSKQRVK